MPNHVKNRIELIGDRKVIKELIEKFSTHYPAEIRKTESHMGEMQLYICENKDGNFGWFNPTTAEFTRRNQEPVIGLPYGFEIEIEKARDHFPDFNKVIPQPENIFNGSLGQAEEDMCRREGRPTWYRWNIDNWGTKWNSYSNKKEDDNIFTFETAWCSVPEIIRQMSLQFPEIEIVYEYADEDTGANTGVYLFKNGLVSENIHENQSKEAYELAFKLRPDYQENYVLVGDSYEYKEEE